MTQQTLDDWLAAGNHITVCPSVPHLSFVRILSILGEDAPAPKPERLCRRAAPRSQAERDRSTVTVCAFSVADGRRSQHAQVAGADCDLATKNRTFPPT